MVMMGTVTPNPVIHGEVIRQTFGNEDNGYRIVKVMVNGEQQSWVGVMPPVSPGMKLAATGTTESDPKWGPQFKVLTCSSSAPTTGVGLVSYLVSGPFPGVGPKTAQAIWDKFGDKTAEVLRLAATDPTMLAKVKGINATAALAIGTAWVEQESVSPILVWLQEQGIQPHVAGKIAAKYKGNTIQVVKANPYRLAFEVAGVGFKTADEIAMRIGIAKDSPARVQAATLHALTEAMSMGGHCWTSRDALAKITAGLIDQRPEICFTAIDILVKGAKIIAVGEQMYAKHIYTAEQNVANYLASLLSTKAHDYGSQLDIDEPKQTLEEIMVSALEEFEKKTGMVLAAAQRAAVEMLVRSKVMVMTGGPGVGKTATLRAILAVLSAAGMKVIMCAPTGRAAKRMTELTGMPAATIHRTLSIDPQTNQFEFNESNPLTCDVIVIDETSMISVELAAALLCAVPFRARVLFVGDMDQLPSIGAGAVLRNMIDSGVIPTTRLTEIFRQAAGSTIITGAHAINNGKMPTPDNENDPRAQFIWHKETDQDQAATLVLELVTKILPAKFGFDPIRDIAVLPPMKRGACGTFELNKRLQAALNPHGKSYKRGGTTYIVGDKVMQLKNDKNRDVYNGDIGYVMDCDQEQKTLAVDYDGRRVEYTSEQLENLTHAYACTGHKMQGSSAKCVVIPLLMAHYMMLTRPWLYTTFTRAETLCVLVADPKAVRMSVGQAKRDIRRTGLTDLLRAAVPPTKEQAAAGLALVQAALGLLDKDAPLEAESEEDPWSMAG
jgi:exodeoxyribonuclease V alpha subunit